MATVNVRGAFQMYKTEEPEATIQEFNSLANEVALPYKILASEEFLAASLALVEPSKEVSSTYAVSIIHNAYVYLSQLASYVPLMSRSQEATKLTVNTELLYRIALLYCGDDRSVLDLVSKLIGESDASSASVSITDLSNLEDAMSKLEKKWRQDIKAKGGKVEQIRRAVVATSPAPKSGPPAQGGDAAAGDVIDGEGEGADGGNGVEVPTSAAHCRRRRSNSQTFEGQSVESGEPVLKGAKTEETRGAAEGGHGGVQQQVPRQKRPTAKAKATAMLVTGRLRGLTNGEKKAVATLNQVIETLARVYANKYNDLIPIFDSLFERVKAVQGIIDAERAAFDAKGDKKPPEPFHETTLDEVFAALAHSTQEFRDDEDCRYELDEDLLHPIAHACLTVINQIEGFDTAPYQEPTDEDRQKKMAVREQLKAKREEAARKMLERAKVKEELAQKKEEEKRLLRIRLGGAIEEDDLLNDDEIQNPVPMGYVHYEKSLPLGSTELFEKALFVWSMLVSVPQPLMLSQMPFTHFLKALLEEDQDANGLMEEITGCLLEVDIEHVRVSSPNTPRITTRGKNWFDALVEFVGVASGNKKKRLQQRRRAPSVTSSSDEEEEEEEEEKDDSFSSDSDSNSSGSNSASSSLSAAEAAEDGEAERATEDAVTEATAEQQQQPVEEEESDSFSAELKATVERVTSLRSLATWGNVDLIDRLNLLQFCVLEAVASDKVVEEADKLFKEREEDASELDKHVKEIREDAEKEMKGLLKNLSSGSPASSPTAKMEAKLEPASELYEEMRAAVLAHADKKRKAVYAKFFSKQDVSDVGAIIQPIGMDRYKRLYWRFPLDRRILVQTTAATAPTFPVGPEPQEQRKRRMGGSLFLDDEQEEEALLLGGNRRRGAKVEENKHQRGNIDAVDDATGDTAQRTWGIIPGEYIAAFAEGLDPRGQREAYLRKALEEMADYVAGMEEPQDGRTTRSRARTFGYLNKLKAYV